MPSMPNSGRKWMCPNHAEQVMVCPSSLTPSPVCLYENEKLMIDQRRRRTVREKMQIVDVDSEGMSNNGNISIIPDEPARPAMQYEDLMINRKKFRIPEKIIKLDFWSKLGYGNKCVILLLTVHAWAADRDLSRSSADTLWQETQEGRVRRV